MSACALIAGQIGLWTIVFLFSRWIWLRSFIKKNTFSWKKINIKLSYKEKAFLCIIYCQLIAVNGLPREENYWEIGEYVLSTICVWVFGSRETVLSVFHLQIVDISLNMSLKKRKSSSAFASSKSAPQLSLRNKSGKKGFKRTFLGWWVSWLATTVPSPAGKVACTGRGRHLTFFKYYSLSAFAIRSDK